MLILAIDTSGPVLSTGLFRDGEALSAESTEIGRGHAERLTPAVSARFSEAGLEPAAVRRIAVTTGPGSFTGLRVGLAFARGLALALGVPAVGIGTMPAIAASHPVGEPFAVVLDARRSEVFAQAFDSNGGPEAGPFRHALGRPFPLSDRLLIGSGAHLLGRGASRAHPDPAGLANLAASAEPNDHPPSPLYLRGADAKLPQAVVKDSLTTSVG